MTIQQQMEYMRLKHRQKNEQNDKVIEDKKRLYKSLDNNTTVGLGNGYATDMREALKQVNEYDYQMSEDEIHYRRLTSGQWIDATPNKTGK